MLTSAFKRVSKTVPLLLLLIASLSVSLRADDAAPRKPPVPAFFQFLMKMAPDVIQNLRAVSHDGKIFLFYDQGRPVPEAAPTPGQTGVAPGFTSFSRMWNGAAWEPAQPFHHITDAVSAGGELLAFTDGGYFSYRSGAWSELAAKPEWKNPCACAAHDQIWVLYVSSGDLLKTTYQAGEWSAPELIEKDWKFADVQNPAVRGAGGAMKAAYAFDRLWVFWVQRLKQGTYLVYKNYANGVGTDVQMFGPAIQFCPLVTATGIDMYYLNWQPTTLVAGQKPSFSGVTGALSEMQQNMQRTYYRSFDGQQWGVPGFVITGQAMMLNPVTLGDSVWLIVASMPMIQYVVEQNGVWSAPKTLSGESVRKAATSQAFKSPMIAFNLAMTLAFYAVFGLVVFLVSRQIEKTKAVTVALGGQDVACASLFRRFLAYSLDGLMFYIPRMALTWVWMAPDGGLRGGNFFMTLFVSIIGFYVVFFGYFVVCETLWGKTVGKRLCGIKVVSLTGAPCGWKSAAIRNLTRLLDAFSGHLVGAIVFGSSAKHQRWGDIVGETLVVIEPAPAK